MKIVLDVDEKYDDLEITVHCKTLNKDIEKIIAILKTEQFIVGKLDNCNYQIELKNVYYFEAIDDHVFMYCKELVYEITQRIYELEEQFSDSNFVRVSKAIILNIDQLDNVKALLNGRYEALMKNGERIIITRHYVKYFKRKFGM